MEPQGCAKGKRKTSKKASCCLWSLDNLKRRCCRCCTDIVMNVWAVLRSTKHNEKPFFCRTTCNIHHIQSLFSPTIHFIHVYSREVLRVLIAWFCSSQIVQRELWRRQCDVISWALLYDILVSLFKSSTANEKFRNSHKRTKHTKKKLENDSLSSALLFCCLYQPFCVN